MGFAAPVIPMILGGIASAALSSAMAPKSAPKAEAQPSQAASTQTAAAPVAPKASDSTTTGGTPPPGMGNPNNTWLTGTSGAQIASNDIGRNTLLGGNA